MGKAVMREKQLNKSITLPSLRIHINCRLLQGMLALMLTAGDRRGGKFCQERFSQHVSMPGSYHSCRQLDKGLVQHATLLPQVTHISSSEAQQIPFQLFCLFLQAILTRPALAHKHFQPPESFSKSQVAWEVFMQVTADTNQAKCMAGWKNLERH